MRVLLDMDKQDRMQTELATMSWSKRKDHPLLDLPFSTEDFILI
jgi:hypothetical protein